MKLASTVFAVFVALLVLCSTLATAQGPVSTFDVPAVTAESQAIPFAMNFFGPLFQVHPRSLNITITISGVKLLASTFAEISINEYDSHAYNISSKSQEFKFINETTILLSEVTFPNRSYPGRNIRYSLRGLVAATGISAPIKAVARVVSNDGTQEISYTRSILDDILAQGGIKVNLEPKRSHSLEYEQFEFVLTKVNHALANPINDFRLFDASPLEQGVFTVLDKTKPTICFVNDRDFRVGLDIWAKMNTYLQLPTNVYTMVQANDWSIRCPNIGLVRTPNPTAIEEFQKEILAGLNSPNAAKNIVAMQQIIRRNLTSSASPNTVAEKKSPLYFAVQAGLFNGQILSSDIYIDRK